MFDLEIYWVIAKANLTGSCRRLRLNGISGSDGARSRLGMKTHWLYSAPVELRHQWRSVLGLSHWVLGHQRGVFCHFKFLENKIMAPTYGFNFWRGIPDGFMVIKNHTGKFNLSCSFSHSMVSIRWHALTSPSQRWEYCHWFSKHHHL